MDQAVAPILSRLSHFAAASACAVGGVAASAAAVSAAAMAAAPTAATGSEMRARGSDWQLELRGDGFIMCV